MLMPESCLLSKFIICHSAVLDSLTNIVAFLSYAEVSDEGRYVVLYVTRGAEPRNKLYYCDLEKLDYKIEGENGFS